VAVALASRVESLCELVLLLGIELRIAEKQDRIGIEQTLDPLESQSARFLLDLLEKMRITFTL
jgi:hypothetical protein